MKRFSFFLLLCLLTSNFVLKAQEYDISKVDWLVFGLGPANKEELSGHLSYTFLGETAYQLAFNTSKEFKIFGDTSNSFYACSLSYGLTDIHRWFFGGVFLGPSFNYENRYEADNKFGVGINLNAQYFFSLADVNGIGVDVFINVNTIRTVYAARVAIFFKSVNW